MIKMEVLFFTSFPIHSDESEKSEEILFYNIVYNVKVTSSRQFLFRYKDMFRCKYVCLTLSSMCQLFE